MSKLLWMTLGMERRHTWQVLFSSHLPWGAERINLSYLIWIITFSLFLQKAWKRLSLSREKQHSPSPKKKLLLIFLWAKFRQLVSNRHSKQFFRQKQSNQQRKLGPLKLILKHAKAETATGSCNDVHARALWWSGCKQEVDVCAEIH